MVLSAKTLLCFFYPISIFWISLFFTVDNRRTMLNFHNIEARDIRLYNVLYFTTKIPAFFKFKMAVFFSFLKLEEQFFQENIYLNVNSILEISKHKFWQQQLIGSCQPPQLAVGG